MAPLERARDVGAGEAGGLMLSCRLSGWKACLSMLLAAARLASEARPKLEATRLEDLVSSSYGQLRQQAEEIPDCGLSANERQPTVGIPPQSSSVKFSPTDGPPTSSLNATRLAGFPS
ncbi:hypothetical protein LY76DRAFT_405588 [Colletotrichum caudatum]|nr:hypothetical protein LY76DRAFT_405588 [Colletotrichum caudatum]